MEESWPPHIIKEVFALMEENPTAAGVETAFMYGEVLYEAWLEEFHSHGNGD